MKALGDGPLLGRPTSVRWADPKLPDPSETVKAVYVGKLPVGTDEEKLKVGTCKRRSPRH